MDSAYFSFPEQMADFLALDADLISAFDGAAVIIDLTNSVREFPRLSIEANIRPDDRQHTPAAMIDMRVHVWTKETGDALCREIAKAAASALTITRADLSGARPDTPGLRIIYGGPDAVKFLPDPDAGIAHGVIETEFRVAPRAA